LPVSQRPVTYCPQSSRDSNLLQVSSSLWRSLNIKASKKIQVSLFPEQKSLKVQIPEQTMKEVKDLLKALIVATIKELIEIKDEEVEHE
jgi:hypothetical protein